MNPTQYDAVLGVIGGSGVYHMEGVEVVAEHAVETPFGPPSDAVVETRIGGRTVFFLPRHGRGHRYLPSEVNYRGNIHALYRFIHMPGLLIGQPVKHAAAELDVFRRCDCVQIRHLQIKCHTSAISLERQADGLANVLIKNLFERHKP